MRRNKTKAVPALANRKLWGVMCLRKMGFCLIASISRLALQNTTVRAACQDFFGIRLKIYEPQRRMKSAKFSAKSLINLYSWLNIATSTSPISPS